MSKIGNTKRNLGESDDEYIYKICNQKDTIGSWSDVADIINAELGFEFTESCYRKKWQSFQRMFDANKEKLIDGDVVLEKMQEQKNEIQKERYKLQAEKAETNKWLRENARDDLIVEKIIDAVKSLPPMQMPEVIPVVHSEREYFLLFGDEHYGVEYEIRGLFNEILNAYSPEIFERRMLELLDNTVEIIIENSITKLNVYAMGDFSDGIIRIGQLMKLRYGVIEGTVKYADFLCNWLNKLTEYTCVVFQMVKGNHTENRLFNQPKGTFSKENTDLFAREIIKTRLANNPNFEMIENPTGLIFDQLLGFNILGIHGECKDLAQTIKDFSSTYKVELDILIGGHMHHGASENVGLGRDVIRVPSIIGIDEFSMDLKKTSNAGATLIILEKGKGKTREYNIKLN